MSMSEYVFTSRYAQYRPDRRRRETWDEAINRVFDMHVRRYPMLEEDINVAREMSRAKLFLGSQRALQFGGAAIERKHARLYNCTGSYCDRVEFFRQMFWLLLCGSGVGFSVQFHHVEQLPRVEGAHGTRRYVVEDTIEGWADAADALLRAYFHRLKRPLFDFSNVRPAGSSLSFGIGKAPGPSGLKAALEQAEAVLRAAEGRKLRPIECYDIAMHLATAVLSGGVRRSATICIFSPDDMEMMTAKTGDWYTKNPQRQNSNNSALLLRNATTFKQYSDLVMTAMEFGEPGCYWATSTEDIPNPCVEIGFHCYDERGRSGFQMCNVDEINGKLMTGEDTFYNACWAASLIGTLQAGYTDFPYLGSVTESIVRREALLGVSITGFMDNPKLLLNPKVLQRGAEVVLEANEHYAKIIGINPAARATCVKPAGTTSALLGCASGIHPYHAKQYIRAVRDNSNELPLQYYQSINPHAVSEVRPGLSCIEFAMEAPEGALTSDSVPANVLLSNVLLVQTNWVDVGRRQDRCVKPWLRNSVSNTITVHPHEIADAVRYVYRNRGNFMGVALTPYIDTSVYEKPPFLTVASEAEKKKFEILKNSKPVDFSKLVEYSDNVEPLKTSACDGGKCSV